MGRRGSGGMRQREAVEGADVPGVGGVLVMLQEDGDAVRLGAGRDVEVLPGAAGLDLLGPDDALGAGVGAAPRVDPDAAADGRRAIAVRQRPGAERDGAAGLGADGLL